jgi:hypothetical protein
MTNAQLHQILKHQKRKLNVHCKQYSLVTQRGYRQFAARVLQSQTIFRRLSFIRFMFVHCLASYMFELHLCLWNLQHEFNTAYIHFHT